MSIFDFFKRGPKNAKPAPTLSGWWPMYPQFGTNIYASDVVQQALKCIVSEIAKLRPTHIRLEDSDPVPMKSTVQDVLNNPNDVMTTTEFLEKVTWLLLLNYNAFIIPTYYTWTDPKTGAERRYYETLTPVNPTEVDFIEDATGRLFVRFWFMDGSETTLPYDDVIHIKYNYSVSEYMGGNETGQPDNKAILKTLQMNEELLKGIAKAMKASYAVNGVVKYNTVIGGEKIEQGIKELEEKLRNSESGILGIDLKGEFIPLEKRAEIVSDDTLRFMDEKILRNWRVPLAILKGDYDKETYEAFYQATLEPIVIALAQAFTKKMFTKREKAFGNRIEFYPKELIFLSVSQTLQLIDTLAPQGGGYVNEYRTWMGLPPLPELRGKRYISLNWIDANNAAEYQVGKNDQVEVIDEEKIDE